MVAYLDYNVFVGIEDGRLTIDDILNKVDNRIRAFPFSAGHIQEVDNITAKDEDERAGFISKRLETIRTLTNCLYIFQEYPSNNTC